jgi:hypothetical protein
MVSLILMTQLSKIPYDKADTPVKRINAFLMGDYNPYPQFPSPASSRPSNTISVACPIGQPPVCSEKTGYWPKLFPIGIKTLYF